MWGSFVWAAIVGIIALFVPGYLFSRSIKLPWWLSIACAPSLSSICYAILSTVYGATGVFCSWLTILIPSLVASLAVFLMSRLLTRNSSARNGSDSPAIAVLYVVVGIVVTSGMYLYQIGSADAFIQSWDNVHHLDAVRGFVESGCWSSFDTTLYLGRDAAIDPFVEGSFYPSGWHGYVALIVSLLDVPVTLAVNAANFSLIAIAFPIGMYALLRSIFGENLTATVAGSLFMLANASCLWMMLTWGPLYPNIMANCLLPGIMAAFVLMLAEGQSRGTRLASFVAVAVGALAYVFIQPNGVFTAVVLLAPYLVVRTYVLVRRADRACARGKSFAKAAGFASAIAAVAVVAAFWVAAFQAPFMQNVVQYRWPCDSTVATAFIDVITQRFHVAGLAWGCALLLVIGIIVALVRRRHRWLIFSWLFACLIYVVCISVDGYWHQFFAGFWYTDVPRVAAMAAFAAVPLQALGLGEAMRLMARPFKKRSQVGGIAAQVAMVVIVALLLYVPVSETSSSDEGPRHFSNASALNAQARVIAGEYSDADPRIYDNAERAFVREVMSIIPEDALVINEPNDGSAYAYGVDGLRTYYRYWRGYGSPSENEKPESALIRARVCNIATDEDVRAAVELVGAQYVLKLEEGERSWNTTMWVYGDGEFWRGIDAINVDTEGFECILARDDMSLYKIVP